MKNENMRKIDIIIILGGGINKDGKVSDETKKRLDFFLKDKNKFLGVPVLLSGRWSGFMIDKPRITEAEAMKEYLMSRERGTRKFIIETKSLDTISNAIFSKQLISKHKYWDKILLITSDRHMERALWIFRKVFGGNYQVIPFLSPTKKLIREKREGYERYFFDFAKKILKDMPTDDRKLVEFLKVEHPFYSQNQKAKKLLEKLITAKKQFSA